MTDLINKASAFAAEAHQHQVRKYTGEPYFNHCSEVADKVREVCSDEEVIAAAYLHDVVEDCGVSLADIAATFGQAVANLVADVTDVSNPSDGNRATRKEIDRQHLAKASPNGQTIKLADIISNTKSIVERDPDFAKLYLQEKRAVLEVLTKGDKRLLEEARAIVYGD